MPEISAGHLHHLLTKPLNGCGTACDCQRVATLPPSPASRPGQAHRRLIRQPGLRFPTYRDSHRGDTRRLAGRKRPSRSPLLPRRHWLSGVCEATEVKEEGMPVVTRRVGEALVIMAGDQPIEITMLGVRGGQIRIGAKAPQDIKVLRKEIEHTPPRINTAS